MIPQDNSFSAKIFSRTFDHFFEYHRLIVCRIGSAEEQRKPVLASETGKVLDHAARFRFFQFNAVAGAELFPFGRIVAKPFSKRRTGREILSPRIEPCPFFRTTSWPYPID